MNQIAVSHILVKHEYEIEDILRLLKEGKSFKELAKRFSLCGSAGSGGTLGLIQKGQTVKNFEEAAFSLNVGETSAVVKTEFGYHLILRES